MTDGQIVRAADRLAEHRLSRQKFMGFAPEDRPVDQSAAYAIQAALHQRLVGRDGVTFGWKIGCTTPVMQAFLSIDSPCAGRMRTAGLFKGPAELQVADYSRVGVECELAVRLGRNLPAGGRPYSRDQVTAAVGACMAAMEIVDDRYIDYRQLDAPTLIADDFFHAGCVLGRTNADIGATDLAGLSGRMLIDGAEVGQGRGADILGDPMAALEWLANGDETGGDGLHAGEIIMLGSLVETKWPEAGSVVRIEIARLGAVEARFT